MEFKFNINKVEFFIKIIQDKKFIPSEKDNLITQKDLKRIKNGKALFYCLFIKSKKGDQSLTHYSGGLILTSNEEQLPRELEEIIEDYSFIDSILNTWTLVESDHGPSWKN
jgi:hypothetical protein